MSQIELGGPNPRIVEAVETVDRMMRLADGREEDHFFRGAEERYRMGCQSALEILSAEVKRAKHNPDVMHLLAITMYSLYETAMIAANLERRLERLEGEGYRPSLLSGLFDRMERPEVGDLVLEVTSRSRRPWPYEGLGVLVDITDETYDGKTVGSVYHVKPVYYRTVCKWTNCHFIAIPTDHGRGPGGPVTFTKKELTAALSNVGIDLENPA
jgi:hypothetical protein